MTHTHRLEQTQKPNFRSAILCFLSGMSPMISSPSALFIPVLQSFMLPAFAGRLEVMTCVHSELESQIWLQQSRVFAISLVSYRKP